MNNVTHIATRTADFSTSQDAEIYYPVSAHPLVTEYENLQGNIDTAGNAQLQQIVREDTGLVIGVHSNQYKMVRNEDVFPKFEDILRKSSLDLSGMYTETHVVKGGGAVQKIYRFPAHQIEIARGDVVDMELRVRNSYDGSWSFGTILGGYRLICSNGMVIGESFMWENRKHTSGLDVDKYLNRLDYNVKIYMDHQEVWKHWAGKKVSESQVETLLKEELKLSDRFVKDIVQGFVHEAQSMGYTIWALFNALTYWSTHEKINKNSERALVNESREKRVRQIINSRGFERLAA